MKWPSNAENQPLASRNRLKKVFSLVLTASTAIAKGKRKMTNRKYCKVIYCRGEDSCLVITSIRWQLSCRYAEHELIISSPIERGNCNFFKCFQLTWLACDTRRGNRSVNRAPGLCSRSGRWCRKESFRLALLTSWGRWRKLICQHLERRQCRPSSWFPRGRWAALFQERRSSSEAFLS